MAQRPDNARDTNVAARSAQQRPLSKLGHAALTTDSSAGRYETKMDCGDPISTPGGIA
jgi:hypothetical protein